MEHAPLRERLQKLGHVIEARATRLRHRAHLHPEETHLRGAELLARQRQLEARLTGEIEFDAAHGRAVSDLERSVQQWLDSTDADHTTTE